uniref:Ribosome biogenesis protein NOP53 n=1 Tax=Trichuris muris TaxID=70415 RepID=A0A5S6QTR7_TRIMR
MAVRRKSAAKISRNKKKYWRRGANISDVEAFLDDRREDERLGAHFTSLNQGRPIFGMDKTPNSAAQFSFAARTIDHQESHRESRKVEKSVPLLVALPRRSGRLRQSEQLSRQWNPPQFFDVWDDCDTESTGAASPLDQKAAELKEYYLRGTSVGFPKIPKTMRLPRSIRKHVDLPHSGSSYNPKYEDHQALLEKACLAEMAKIKKEKALKKAAALPKYGTPSTEETDIQEMVQSFLSNSDSQDLPEIAVTCGDDDSVNMDKPPKSVPAKPKTKAQRRHAAAEKALKKQLEKEKQQRVRENNVYRLKRIKKEIRRQEEMSRKRQERRKALRVQKLLGPARMGPHKFEPPDDDVLLSNELPNSLRRLKPEGSIMADRYKNLQLRNIIETRIWINKKRRRPYKYIEKSAVRCVDERYIPDNPLGIGVQ